MTPIIAPGRYLGRFSCREGQCQDKSHCDVDGKHFSIVIHFHIPRLGIVVITAHSEQEADQLAQKEIYRRLASLYVEETKRLMELEHLMKEVEG